MKKILSLSLGLIFIGNFLFAQAVGDFRSNGTGNWNVNATWQTWTGSWTAATSYPGQNTGTGAVLIQNGDVVAITATVPNAIGSLALAIGNSNNTLTINAGTSLTVTGGIIITGGASGGTTAKTIIVNGTLNAADLAMVPGASNTRLAVLEINAGGTVSISGNLIMPATNGLEQRTLINSPSGGTLSVGGNLTGGTINGGTGTFAITGNLTGGTTINLGTGIITVNGSVTGATINPVAAGTVNITGAAASDTVTAGSATINIGGNISAPVVTGFTGTVNINGGGTQTTAGPITLLNLGMTNAASTLQLGGNLTVTGTLTLTNGKINTGTNLLILTNATPASQLSGGSSTSYVYSTGAGRLQRNGLLAATAYTFPVGTATNYLPVIVTPTTTSNFAINAFTPATTNGVEGGPAFADASKIVNAVWNIDRPVGTGNSTITIQWADALEGATFATFGNSQIGISQNIAGSWGVAIATSANAAANTVTATFALNLTGIFGVGEVGVALPVKFGAIKAYEKQNGIQLDWKVYSENKVRNYDIERSADGRSYTSVGSLPALYNNTSDGDYGFFDPNPLPGTSYYRIKNNDLDGKSAYSIVMRVNRNKTIKGLSLYPNPIVNGIVLLQGSDLGRGSYKINIFGANGQDIYKQQIKHNGGTITHTIELPSTISKGVYMFSVKDENGNIIFKNKLVNQ